ncbi:MAG: cobaltochelatase CobT-related protein [Candidatus Limivicinus sp.]|jgi:hypothetical protein
MEQISDFQKRRAVNIIWTAADNHSFSPDFKAYDSEGYADLYWNCIIGAVRQHYDYPQIEEVFRGFKQYEDSDQYESLFWLGLENCVYLKEVENRPVLKKLRESYARAFVKAFSGRDDYRLYEAIATAHFSRVLGVEPKMNKYDIKLLNELEFTADMSTEDIVQRAKEMFERWFQISTEERKQNRTPWWMFGKKKREKAERQSRYRHFGIGIADHPDNIYGTDTSGSQQLENQVNTKMSAEELRNFMETKFGKAIYDKRKVSEIERGLCTGNHQDCHLHFTRGEPINLSEIESAFEAYAKQHEAAQIEKNKASYKANRAQNNVAIAKLSNKIQNSILLHLQPSQVKSNSGHINGGKVWRAVHLNDDKVFIKREQDDMGDLSVDILLDASTSQQGRQEIVSAQGYIIAQSLTRCGVPCRVMSFCSMTGYTIMRIFRDYDKPRDNEKIFEYVSNGCNRDGLAIAAAHHLMNQSSCEHKMLIILSDVKPNDIVKIRRRSGDEPIPYEHQAGITDTAYEVRKARADGISVICVFTGVDEDLPSAKLVYGRDFARIQTLDKLADTVGMLIQNQIKNL